MTVAFAVPDDFALWLDLAREVEPLFGPMAAVPEFRQALQAAIAAGQALGSVSPDAPRRLNGGVIVDPAANDIAWLAVTASARGAGLGDRLLAAALAHLDPQRPVSVTTFAAGIPAGAAAHRLYHRHGFVVIAAGPVNPAGYATDVMQRAAASHS
ncbi:MAG TPA: GNAT family N-acetyltransferase [bacterium]|nr:GNAT family N-acetyltransferase [bacterium]